MQLQPITKQQYKVLFNQQSLVLKKLEEINERLNQLEAEDHGPYKISFVRKIHRRIQEPAPYRFTTPQAFLKQLHGKRK